VLAVLVVLVLVTQRAIKVKILFLDQLLLLAVVMDQVQLLQVVQGVQAVVGVMTLLVAQAHLVKDLVVLQVIVQVT
jgi:hypothetical protein